MTRILIILTIILMTSCGLDRRRDDYSKEFYKTITNSGIKIKYDSLIFPKDAHIEPILMPTFLEPNKEYHFIGDNGLEIVLTRTNYTDIKYELKEETIIDYGIASLRPTFYLGAESYETDEGEFWVTDYDIIKSRINCLQTLRIGNQSFTDEKSRDQYLFVIGKTDCQNENLNEINEIWKLKK